jgi:hypothetical protein
MSDPNEITDNPTDALARALWHASLTALMADPTLSREHFVAKVMRHLAALVDERPGVTDVEGFERALRAKLERWWPTLRARAAALNEAGVIPGVIRAPEES